MSATEAGGGAKLCKYSRQRLCKYNMQRLLARAMLSDARIADVAPLVRNDPHLEAGAGAHAARITSANSRAGAARRGAAADVAELRAQCNVVGKRERERFLPRERAHVAAHAPLFAA